MTSRAASAPRRTSRSLSRFVLCPVALSPLALCAGAAGLYAQSITPLVQEGDTVPGVGVVTGIQNVAINSSGQWTVEVDTDNADTDADEVMLRDGLVYLVEGQALPLPLGATLDGFDALNRSELGFSAWNLRLDGTPGGIADDTGVYVDTVLVVQEGGISTAPEFSAGTPYTGFFDVKINEANQLLVVGEVDDPALSSTIDRALVRMDLDASGALLSETVVVKEGDVLPGQTESVEDVETGPHAFAFNNLGQALYVVDLEGDASVDGAVYQDGTLLAQEGAASPAAGRNWATLARAEVDLNDAGDTVLSAQLDGDAATSAVLVKNGAVFLQEGDVPSGVAPDAITGFGTGPVLLTERGNVLWFATLTGAPSTAESLWLDQRLLVRTGVTQVNGVTITDLSNLQDGYTISPNGRHVVFEATLSDGTNGAYRLDLGPASAVSRNGAGTNTVCLVSVTDPVLGEDWIATVDATGHPGALATVILAYDLPLTGLPTPWGELLVSPEALGGTLAATSTVFGGGLNVHTVPLPADASLATLTAYTQALIVGGGPELCNAVDVTLGF